MQAIVDRASSGRRREIQDADEVRIWTAGCAWVGVVTGNRIVEEICIGSNPVMIDVPVDKIGSHDPALRYLALHADTHLQRIRRLHVRPQWLDGLSANRHRSRKKLIASHATERRQQIDWLSSRALYRG